MEIRIKTSLPNISHLERMEIVSIYITGTEFTMGGMGSPFAAIPRSSSDYVIQEITGPARILYKHRRFNVKCEMTPETATFIIE